MKKNCLLLFCLITLYNGALFAQAANTNEIIVKYIELQDFQAAEKLELTQFKRIISSRFNLVLYSYNSSNISFPEINSLLSKDDNVLWVAPNESKIKFRTAPDDSLYHEQWALSNIDIEPFWEKTKGGITPNGDTIVIAVIESGFSLNHPDLVDNYWHNYQEIPDDGIDNDGNGYVDDFNGWNSNLSNDNHSYHWHGTAVSGIIGAKSDNQIGISNVNWDIKLMPISISKDTLVFFDDLFTSFEYIITQRERYNNSNGAEGAFIVAINESFGLNATKPDADPRYTQWCEYMDILGEVGILTIGATNNTNLDVEIWGDMPTNCPQDYLIAVTAIKEDGTNFTGYGAQSIDLAAPGYDIYTTFGADKYKTFSGTSLATPLVSSAVALIYSYPCERWGSLIKTKPNQAALQVKDWILKNTKSTPSVRDNTTTGGRLNLDKIIDNLDFFCEGNRLEPLTLKINPNLTNHFLKYEYDLPKFSTFSLQVSNIIGQVIFAEKYTSNKTTRQEGEIDVSFFPSGLYFLTITQDDKYATQKFIRE